MPTAPCYKKAWNDHKLTWRMTGNNVLNHKKFEDRCRSSQRCIRSLHRALCLHYACECIHIRYGVLSCTRMIRVVAHAKDCRAISCPTCRELRTLCCFHGRHCQEAKCLVKLLVNVKPKHKLRQQLLRCRIQQAEMLRRRLAAVPHNESERGKLSVAVLPKPTASVSLLNALSGTPQDATPAAAGSRQNRSIPPSFLLELCQTLKLPTSPVQLQELHNILKSNPALLAAFLKQRAEQNQQQ